MDVAFHLRSISSASYLRTGQPRRRLLGLLRLLADFTQGPVRVFGGAFRYWMLESYLPAVANGQDHDARIQEAKCAFRKRWVQELLLRESDWPVCASPIDQTQVSRYPRMDRPFG